jgi:nitrite reductase/ring-hydroxylating ferredoxin subunit
VATVGISGRTRVGGHRREVGAAVERVWENVLDWEHLPWLHRTSFSRIERVDSGAWGWRARVGLAPAEPAREILLELRIWRDAGRYVSRTLEGPGAGTEIWTELAPRGARTAVEVAFFVPDVPAERAAAVGATFERLYARLWDEDEAMMVRRTRELARVAAPAERGGRVPLGSLVELRRRLPLVVEQGGRRWRVVEVAGELLAHATRCPHRLGPLEESPLEDGRLRCPWHGYRFDPRTGASCDGRRLRLEPAPRVEIDAAGRVSLAPPGASPGEPEDRNPRTAAAKGATPLG